MSEELNPASKKAAPVVHAPYLCPGCGLPADNIMMTVVGSLAILWHDACKYIIGSHLMVQPQRRSSIIVPGRQ